MEIGRYTAGFLIVLLLSIIFGVFVVDYEKEAISDEMKPVFTAFDMMSFSPPDDEFRFVVNTEMEVTFEIGENSVIVRTPSSNCKIHISGTYWLEYKYKKDLDSDDITYSMSTFLPKGTEIGDILGWDGEKLVKATAEYHVLSEATNGTITATLGYPIGGTLDFEVKPIEFSTNRILNERGEAIIIESNNNDRDYSIPSKYRGIEAHINALEKFHKKQGDDNEQETDRN